jgi:integrase
VLKIEDTKNRLARTIDLNRDLVAILREHRVRQAEHRLCTGLAWHDGGWVCASEIGTPINPYNITRAYHPLQTKAGVPRIRFHDLRHTCASMLLAAGVPVHVVSRQLGHASTAITMRVYTHLMPGQGTAAAEVLRRTLALEG